MAAYYNEHDPYAAQWLRNLIAAGHIAPGDVDERDIRLVHPDDLRGYRQCHFFAGIGVWSYALRLVGWEDDRPIWTGSCPCQPYSAAGKGAGAADERHLWPAWYHLIEVCRPVRIYGEQVASKPALAWLDLVHTDLEGAGYAFGAIDLCAAGVGAPHIRQRLFFVAYAEAIRLRQGRTNPPGGDERVGTQGTGERLANNGRGELVHTECEQLRTGRSGGAEQAQAGVQGAHGERERFRLDAGEPSTARDVDNAELHGLSAEREPSRAQDEGRLLQPQGPSATSGFWHPADWLPCIDGKARPVEPKYVALVDGIAGGMGLVRTGTEQEKEEVDAPQDNRNGGAEVRTVRQDGEATCASQGREPGQQCRIELADFVRLLPQSLALAKLHRDTATQEALHALLEASGTQRLVQYPPHQVEAAWQSLGEEAQDRFCRWLADGKGGFMRMVEHPLAHGAPARVRRLRAYGNAIVAPLAAEFIRTTMTFHD